MRDRFARIQRIDRLTVIVDSGIHRSDQRDVVGDGRGVRKQFRQIHPAFAMLGKLPGTSENSSTRLGRVIVLDLTLELGPIQTIQFWLGIEQIHVTRSPLHEERDHGRRFGRDKRGLGQDIKRRLLEIGLNGGSVPAFGIHAGDCQAADAKRGRRDKFAT